MVSTNDKVALQANMVREKEKEGDELRASIAESNQESEANIEMKRRQTQNNIKVCKCI